MSVITKGFGAFRQALKSMRKAIDDVINRELKRQAELLKTAIRQEIIAGVPPPNRAITLALKDGGLPLWASGDLYKALETTAVVDQTVYVGIPASSKAYKHATIVHDGALIPVTERMRGLFMLLWKTSESRRDPARLYGRARELWDRWHQWPRIPDGKVAINIPPRPFILRALTKFRPGFEKGMSQAVLRTLIGLSRAKSKD